MIAETVYNEGPADLLDTFWGVQTYTPPTISTPGNDEMNAWVRPLGSLQRAIIEGDKLATEG